MQATIVVTLDLKGLSCPIPIARTATAMRVLHPGELLEVFATDPGSVADFRAWATATGNPLRESGREGGIFHFILQKREAGI